MSKDYLKISRATDINDFKDRFIYRVLEIMPGFLAWATLLVVIFLSWRLPAVVAIFIILFDIYWFFKTIYLSFHLHPAYRQMKKNLKIDWLEKLNQLPVTNYKLPFSSWQSLYHLIILPIYKEETEVVRDCFRNLAKSNYPQERFIVVLAVEERAKDSALQAVKEIEKEFGDKFFRFLIIWHPANIPREMAGKSSNIAWAGHRVKEIVIDPLKIPYENIIVSIFDIDTNVPQNFFACLTYHYLTADKPLRSSFQPIPIYTNNIWQAPAFSRIFAFSNTFWQMMQQSRSERLVTFSSQSIGFKALVDIDFWQPNVVNEDSRIFWQCLLFYDGDWQTVPLFYPVYMDANVDPSFWQTFKNQYKQIRRWAYGVENNPYFLFGFLKNKKIPLFKKWHHSWFTIEMTHSLATNSLLIFLLGWLPLVLGGQEFKTTILAFNLPQLTSWIMMIAMIGIPTSAMLSILLLPKRPANFGRFKYFWMFIQWLLVPLNLIFFGAIPALEAQTRLMLGKYMGFWTTPKIRK